MLGTFLSDSFSDTDGTLLSAHVPNNGGTWTASSQNLTSTGANTVTASISSGTLVGSSSTATNRLYVNTVAPPSAAYDITCTWNSAALNVSVNGLTGVAARVQGTASTPANRYWFRYDGSTTVGSRQWVFGKLIGTSTTILSSFVEDLAAGTHRIICHVTDGSKTLTVDGVQKCSSVDNAITAAGLVGTNGTVGVTGAYIDDLAVVGGPGPNPPVALQAVPLAALR